MRVEKGLRYTKTHEWLRLEDDKGRVGVTDYAQEKLTDVIYLELPEVGKEVKKGEELCSLESVKAVAEFYAPVSGVVVEVNDKLENSPELVNQEPYGAGWIAVLRVKDKKEIDELLGVEDYKHELEKK